MKLPGIPDSGLRRIAQEVPPPWSAHSLEELQRLVRDASTFGGHVAAMQALLDEWDTQLEFQDEMIEVGIYNTPGHTEAEFEPSWDLVVLTREALADFYERRYGDDHDDAAYQKVVGFLKGFSGG